MNPILQLETAAPTLAELAVTKPGATRVFLAHGLDFCCNGRRTLAAACAEKGLDPARILSEIEAQSPENGDLSAWKERSLTDLLGFIETHYHARLRAELPELIALARKVESVHADKPACPRGLSAHLDMIHRSVLDHLAKEEQVLFPMIRAGRGSMAAGPMRIMEDEHVDHGKNLRTIRDLTADLTAPDEACTTWRALYLRLEQLEAELMEHIHLENNVLFPRALFA